MLAEAFPGSRPFRRVRFPISSRPSELVPENPGCLVTGPWPAPSSTLSLAVAFQQLEITGPDLGPYWHALAAETYPQAAAIWQARSILIAFAPLRSRQRCVEFTQGLGGNLPGGTGHPDWAF